MASTEGAKMREVVPGEKGRDNVGGEDQLVSGERSQSCQEYVPRGISRLLTR
jgi:hypothetical protein